MMSMVLVFIVCWRPCRPWCYSSLGLSGVDGGGFRDALALALLELVVESWWWC